MMLQYLPIILVLIAWVSHLLIRKTTGKVLHVLHFIPITLLLAALGIFIWTGQIFFAFALFFFANTLILLACAILPKDAPTKRFDVISVIVFAIISLIIAIVFWHFGKAIHQKEMNKHTSYHQPSFKQRDGMSWIE